MIAYRPSIGGLLLLVVAASASAQNGGPLGTPIPDQPLGRSIDGDRPGPEAFLGHQLAYPRVSAARDSADHRLRLLFADRGVDYPAPEIFLRVFKHERVMELWARSDPQAGFTLIKEYPVCALPGQLGPKRQMGDVQVPEGFYFIDQFNPRSDFHLSLRVSYPNIADRMRREALSLGGDIYVHGGCATIGCVPIEDRNIEEVYWLAVQATHAGQPLIPIHIFPSRMDPKRMRWLEDTFRPSPELLAFWNNLRDGYVYFEESRHVPWITVDPDGTYAIPERPRLAGDSASADPAADPAPLTATPAVVVPDSLPRPAAADSAAGAAADSAAAGTAPAPRPGA